MYPWMAWVHINIYFYFIQVMYFPPCPDCWNLAVQRARIDLRFLNSAFNFTAVTLYQGRSEGSSCLRASGNEVSMSNEFRLTVSQLSLLNSATSIFQKQSWSFGSNISLWTVLSLRKKSCLKYTNTFTICGIHFACDQLYLFGVTIPPSSSSYESMVLGGAPYWWVEMVVLE